MSIPELPTPEDLGERLLIHFFGSGATIVAVFSLAMSLLAWKSAAVTSIGVGRHSMRHSMKIARHVLTLGPVAFSFALLVSVLLVAVQGLWIWTCFIAGNAWSYMIHPPGEVPEGGPQWALILGSLRWDLISELYFGVCLVALLACYISAARGNDLTEIGFFIMAPTGLVVFVAAPIAVLVLIGTLIFWASDGVFALDPFGKGILLLLGLAMTHIITTFMALATPSQMRDVWART